jgi:hypothetical protein
VLNIFVTCRSVRRRASNEGGDPDSVKMYKEMSPFEITKTSVLIVENLTVILEVRESVHHSKIYEEKSNKMQQYIKIFIIPYLYKAKHFSSDTPPPLFTQDSATDR